MRALTLFVLLALTACAPVRGDDDDAAVSCPNEDCTVAVINPRIECSEGMPGATAIVEEDGTVVVQHSAFTQGCCPEYAISAILDVPNGQVLVEYGISNDFCDCICSLGAVFTLVDLPAGTWELVLPYEGSVDVEL